MANELLVGVKIGAALAGSFQAAFATAKGTLGQLGQAADLLKARHDRMGNTMAQALAHPMRNEGALRSQYGIRAKLAGKNRVLAATDEM